MTVEARLRVRDVWEMEAYDAKGKYLGRVEAVGFGRGEQIRRIAVRRSGALRHALRFVPFDGARLEGDRLILPAAVPELVKPLRVVH